MVNAEAWRIRCEQTARIIAPPSVRSGAWVADWQRRYDEMRNASIELQKRRDAIDQELMVIARLMKDERRKNEAAKSDLG